MQHFKSVDFFDRCNPLKRLSYRKQCDIRKNAFVLTTNKALLRISYLDIDKVDYFIKKAIKKIKSGEKSFIMYSDKELYEKAYYPRQFWATVIIQRFYRKYIKK